MKSVRIYVFFVAIVFFVLGPFEVKSAQIPQGITVQTQYAKEEGRVWARILLDIVPEYYTYAPLDAFGESVSAEQVLRMHVVDEQGKATLLYAPRGEEREDYYEKGKTIYAYMGRVALYVPFAEAQARRLEGSGVQGQLSLLLCSSKHCLPVRIPLNFKIKSVSALPSIHDQSYAKAWQQLLKQGPVQQDLRQEKLSTSQKTLSTSGLAGQVARFKQGQKKDENPTWDFNPQSYAPALEVTGVGKALFLGLLAGFILNLMPCVLPVLTLKVQALLLAEEGPSRIQAFRTHNLFFAAGIWTQFLILGFLLGSLGLMWGEFFQNVYFVAAMLVIIFALSLSLMGLFSLPMFDIKAGVQGSARRQAFFTGMLATLLATPCSGPLLGGVLSWAFLQPLYLIVGTIMAVGLGMSLPYMMLAWQPQWVRFLPRPGAWMQVMEKMVAFFLLGTCLYIFTLLPEYAHIPMLGGLLILSMLGWLWGFFGGLQAPAWRRRALALCFVCAMWSVTVYGVAEPSSVTGNSTTVSAQWQDFHAMTFQKQLGKEPLLVEFTADWCPNCKYVEKTVLTQENLAHWHSLYGLRYIKVDITRDNAAGEALLHSLGSRSIPMTAIFGMGDAAKSPMVLRDIFTKESLEDALKRTLKPALHQ